nr:DUF2807 domain-containing protein [Bacteroidota bacterium]
MNKLNYKIAIISLISILLIGNGSLFAQTLKGNKKVEKQERSVDRFSGIDIGGAFNLYFTQGEAGPVVVEADENLLDNIETKVKGDVLYINSSHIKTASKLNIYISNPVLELLKVSGAATVKSENTIRNPSLEIEASGASRVELDIEVGNLETNASGASFLRLSGLADKHSIDCSGAAEIKAADLVTRKTEAQLSGASKATVNATEEVDSESSGAGILKVIGDPEIIKTNKPTYSYRHDDRSTRIRTWEDGDTTIVKVAGVTVEVIEGDSTKVSFGNHNLVVDDRGNVKWRRNRIQKFNGHWAGFDMGINGFVTKDNNIDIPNEYDFMTLKYEKSVDVNINFYEQNINLINNKFGLITGMGLRWNNYRFENNIVLVPDSSQIYGYSDLSRSYTKSKLVVNTLNIPILFEYQTNRFSRRNSFHITAGVIFGWRYATHTKVMYKDNGRQKPKNWNSFHMNPFKYDATVRIGWGIINLYATYQLNAMFKDNRGPELYPFAVGITFVGW